MKKKKKYVQPKIVVVAEETEHYLLAASGASDHIQAQEVANDHNTNKEWKPVGACVLD
jgi:hypothetical protein